MVFTVDSVSLEEAPQSVSSLYHQFPKLREAARTLVDKRRQVVAGARSLYLTVREFAISHNQDSKLDIMGTDNLANNVAIIIKNQGKGSLQFLAFRVPFQQQNATIIFSCSVVSYNFSHYFANKTDKSHMF